MGGNVRRGEHRQIGGDGEWKGTRAIVGVGNRIYASHENGKLFAIDADDGRYRQIGDSARWNTRFLFSISNRLVAIETSGTMWAVDPSDGECTQVGKDGEWANITAGDWTRENIYCRSSQGTLWAFSHDGGWRQIGSSTGWKSTHVFAGRGVTTVEPDGQIWRVDVQTGQSQSFGNTRHKVICGVGMHGHVYAHFDDGGVWDMSLDDGSWSQLGTSHNWQSQAMVTVGDDLVSLERSGTLFQLGV